MWNYFGLTRAPTYWKLLWWFQGGLYFRDPESMPYRIRRAGHKPYAFSCVFHTYPILISCRGSSYVPVPRMNILRYSIFLDDNYIIANVFLENEWDAGGPGHRKGFLLFSGQKFWQRWVLHGYFCKNWVRGQGLEMLSVYVRSVLKPISFLRIRTCPAQKVAELDLDHGLSKPVLHW
jgi:hypothetical protein